MQDNKNSVTSIIKKSPKKKAVAMYDKSVRIEQMFYRASCVYKYFFCKKIEDLVLFEIRPAGVYRSCDKCKKCEITVWPKSSAEKYIVEIVNISS